MRSVTTIVEYLSGNREPYPEWLRSGSRAFDRSDFFSSRTIYYPGSGDDGQPVKLCAKARAAHAFVYTDYGVSRQTLSEQLRHATSGFKGYALEHEESVLEADLGLGGWKALVDTSANSGVRSGFATVEPFAWFVVLRRKDSEGNGDAHGPERLAGLFLGGDGFATYDALYCQSAGTRAPFLVVLQDCGFGGNWDRFGKSGILENISRKFGILPEYLLVADNTEPWTGYHDTGAVPESGGQQGHPRHLFKRGDI